MGVFLNTAAYGYNPVVGAGFCTATSQTAGYTYYYAESLVDISIPRWTFRIANSLTSSGTGTSNGIGCIGFSCNAQYSTASYGGAQSNSNVSTRSTNGVVTAYGLGMRLVAFSSESCYTDSVDALSTGPSCARAYNVLYGNTNKQFVLRDTTKYISWTAPNNWGNQPYLNTCATYAIDAAAHQYVSCSTGTTYTSSLADTQCAREYQLTAASTNLTITNYYSSSCGTY
jgi:hypothetical protein